VLVTLGPSKRPFNCRKEHITITRSVGHAGHGAMVAAHLDAKLQARLKAVNLHDKNLLDLTQEWLGAAKQIGQLARAFR
jgi:hypothetical protein